MKVLSAEYVQNQRIKVQRLVSSTVQKGTNMEQMNFLFLLLNERLIEADTVLSYDHLLVAMAVKCVHLNT